MILLMSWKIKQFAKKSLQKISFCICL